MASILSLRCPNCSANLNIQPEKQICFCPYCGTKIHFDDGNREITYRYVDEAQLQKLHLEQAKVKSQENYHSTSYKSSLYLKITLALVWIISLIFFSIISYFTTDSAGFSIFHIIIIIDVISGISLLKKIL